MALHARENIACDLSVFLGCAALEVVLCAALKAEVLGLYCVGLVPAVFDFADLCRRAERDFVELVGAVDNHAALYAEADKNLSKRLNEVRVVNAEKLHFRRGGVGERSENIENCAEAELAADCADILHRGVVLLREEEAHSGFVKELYASLRALVDVYAEGFKTVGGAAARGSGAVAVLRDLHAACCRDERRGGGDVEAVRVVAARADDFKHIHARFYLRRVIAHGSRAARDFVGGLSLRALCRESREESRVLCGRGVAVHDLVHDFVGFGVGQIFLVYDFNDCFLDHNYFSLSITQNINRV